MRRPCCTDYLFPCYYGNSAQSVTKSCSDPYWDSNEAVTETTAADTIFSPNCMGDANDIALELAEYEAWLSAQCQDGCCWEAVCVSLINPTDIQYLDYWSIDFSIRFTQNVTICVSDLSMCEGMEGNTLGFFPGFRPPIYGPTPVGIITAYGNPELGETCVTLMANTVYTFIINDRNISTQHYWNNNYPEKYSIGWSCDNNCPPRAQSRYALNFPFAIAMCRSL